MATTERAIRKLAVIGAGNMGSGIAQKMATEGFDVTLVDLDDARVARGVEIVRRTLAEGVERRIFRPEQADAIAARIHGTSEWSDLAGVDAVVEAVFEDLDVKRQVLGRLDEVCDPDTILATNTSSFSVGELAAATRRPERVLGLHYFYHPAKNRLVEVVAGEATHDDVFRAAWTLQEQLGKTPIRSADASGFIVNRYFVPWLNEAVRLLEEGVADIPTIEAACKTTFGVGMGPFELMNVTGVAIALHASTTLGRAFGPLYAPAERLRRQVEDDELWPLEGSADTGALDAVSERLLAVVFLVAGALVDERVGTPEDIDVGARVGLRWPAGPFELINGHGVDRAGAAARSVAKRWGLRAPEVLATQAANGEPFRFKRVRSDVRGGVATLTINRPDAMNALNEEVVEQLGRAFRSAAADPQVRGIVLAGSGKAFVAGADIRFVRNIDDGHIDRIVEFTRNGQELLREIERCPKPVIARLHGLALGGGLELALACGRIVASHRATMAFPETGIGIYPGLGGTQRTPRRVGAGLAKWLIFTGQMLSAEKARDIKLVDEVVPHAELDATIRRTIEAPSRGSSPTWPLEFAKIEKFFNTHRVEEIRKGKTDTGGDPHLARAVKRVATKAPVALRIAERLIEHGASGDLDEGLRLELDHLPEIFGTEDAYEGLSSLGKKRPSFRGR